MGMETSSMQVYQMTPLDNKREFNDVLFESIDETIVALLSQEVANALYSYLEKIDPVSKDEVPTRLDALFLTLEKLFGPRSSVTISKAIARKLYAKLELTFPEIPDIPGRRLPEYVQDVKINLLGGQS